MQSPDFLKKGDLIIIVAPAGKIDYAKIDYAKKYLEKIGFLVEIGKNVNKPINQFSANAEQRLHDFQQAIDNKKAKAILCARGGYGTIQIIDKLNFSNFKKHPKWIIGYSDITVLHSCLNTQIKYCSVHGTMPINFSDDKIQQESFASLLNAITGKKNKVSIKTNKNNILGNAQGELVGGNLSILYSLRGTKYDIDTNNKILFIEDLSEHLYHIDRIMHNLKLGGKLKNLKALIVGGFTNMLDNDNSFGKSVNEIILNAVKEYNYPVIFDFPAGHQAKNFALKLGCNVEIICDKNKTQVLQ